MTKFSLSGSKKYFCRWVLETAKPPLVIEADETFDKRPTIGSVRENGDGRYRLVYTRPSDEKAD